MKEQDKVIKKVGIMRLNTSSTSKTEHTYSASPDTRHFLVNFHKFLHNACVSSQQYVSIWSDVLIQHHRMN